jgi:hypothetical protein
VFNATFKNISVMYIIFINNVIQYSKAMKISSLEISKELYKQKLGEFYKSKINFELFCDIKRVHGTLRAAGWSRSSKASIRNNHIVFKFLDDDGLSKFIMKDKESSLSDQTVLFLFLVHLSIAHLPVYHHL